MMKCIFHSSSIPSTMQGDFVVACMGNMWLTVTTIHRNFYRFLPTYELTGTYLVHRGSDRTREY